jgi:uncharacterized protein YdaU (DUF1376 family)
MRHGKGSVNKAAFLFALARPPRAGQPLPSVAHAAAAGVHRATPYRWRATDPDFAVRWVALEAQQLRDRIAANAIAERKRIAAWEARKAELRPARQQQAARMRAVLARNRKAGR